MRRKSSVAGYFICGGGVSYEAKAKERFEAGSVKSGCRQMRDHIHNVPQREKRKQRTRIGTLRVGMSVLGDGVPVAMPRVNLAKRIEEQR